MRWDGIGQWNWKLSRWPTAQSKRRWAPVDHSWHSSGSEQRGKWNFFFLLFCSLDILISYISSRLDRKSEVEIQNLNSPMPKSLSCNMLFWTTIDQSKVAVPFLMFCLKIVYPIDKQRLLFGFYAGNIHCRYCRLLMKRWFITGNQVVQLKPGVLLFKIKSTLS